MSGFLSKARQPIVARPDASPRGCCPQDGYDFASPSTAASGKIGGMPTSIPPAVTFWGAARTVTGSMHLLEANGRKLLLDCGLYQGRRSEAYQRNSTFPFPPNQIHAVVLSHAHMDHCGNLPNLVRQGFNGPIYSTPATRDLAAVMLLD